MIIFGSFLPSLLVGSDRKSTRLNSSHLVISYAVFCLKKKSPRLSLGAPPMLRAFVAPPVAGKARSSAGEKSRHVLAEDVAIDVDRIPALPHAPLRYP